MRTAVTAVVVLVSAISLSAGRAVAQEDRKGCTDHPLFSRMPGFYIQDCGEREFDVHDFVDPVAKKKVSVEGRVYYVRYGVKKGAKGSKSNLQIARNYTNAIKKIGGDSLMERPSGKGRTWMRVKEADKDIWAAVEQDSIRAVTYRLWIAERAEMEQQVVADAKSLAEGLASSGHVAIYGIYFDFDESKLRPESEPALVEMAKLLEERPDLSVFVVGHTDNVGDLEYNLKLSRARADSVVKALSTRFGVSAGRLEAHGLGQLAPVASNRTEEERSKNRRVELVEQ